MGLQRIRGTVHCGTVKNGKLCLDSTKEFAKALIPYEGKNIQISLSERRRRRSLNQNAYYWAVVVPILADHFGYTSDEMHEALKFEHLSERNLRTGLARVRSTTDLSTKEFEDYCSLLRTWALTEYEVYIPQPNEIIIQDDGFYYRKGRSEE